MAKDKYDNQIDGQMTITDLYAPPEKLFAVSRIFARARKEMSLAEQKTFAYALTRLKFKEDITTSYVTIDKKTLANILGVQLDSKHLSVDLFNKIKYLPKHSFIEFADEDQELYSNGVVIANVDRLRNTIRIHFNSAYMNLFTNLESNYITLWSKDIFDMNTDRGADFYEYLRQATDTRNELNSIGMGVRAIKELFNIPKSGKGSYMRKDGHFDRPAFEKYVIDSVCKDLQHCQMIKLTVQPTTGKFYEKIKTGGRVIGYKFYWMFTAYPAVADAEEVKQIQERVDKDPQVLKIAKDIVAGDKAKKTAKKTQFNDFPQRNYDMTELEKRLFNQ